MKQTAKTTKRLLRFLVLVQFLILTGQLFAQNITVKGRVLKDDGQPVQGASVLQKGTNVGTTTDVDGNFSITAANGSVIVISSVGFITQEVTVSGTDMKVQLVSDTKSMGEVIVVGYGSQRKRDVTGLLPLLPVPLYVKCHLPIC